MRAFNIALSITISRIILFCCFVTYVLVFPTERLSAEQVFVVMTIFNTLRHTMTWMFPQSVGIGSELYVSCLRVQVCNRNYIEKLLQTFDNFDYN